MPPVPGIGGRGGYAQPKKKPWRTAGMAPRSSTGSRGGGGGARPSGGGGIATARAAGGNAYARGTAQAAPARPRYTGPPPPSAASIQQLYGQLGDINRSYNRAGTTYKLGVSREQAARSLFLRQLADTYTQRQTDLAADYANRGLSQSGLLNEAVAQLGKQRAGEQSEFEAGYRGRISDLLRTLTTERSELKRRKGTVRDRYQQSRADRARILRLMGG